MPLRRHRIGRRTLTDVMRPPASAIPIDGSLANELRARLEAAGETELVGAVGELRVVEPCACDDPQCASFYALPRFQTMWLWNRGGRTISLGGGYAIDVVGDRIVAVEVIREPSIGDVES